MNFFLLCKCIHIYILTMSALKCDIMCNIGRFLDLSSTGSRGYSVRCAASSAQEFRLSACHLDTANINCIIFTLHV